jgi:photosystem II stability/assembly factor-like uncharacterized protein
MHLASQPYVWQNATINGTGFVTGVVYSPAQAGLVYAYTDMGGAYRYDEPLGRWTPLNDWSKWNDWSVQQLGIEAMAADPTDANRVYAVAGTYNSPAAFLRSSDQGRTWARTDMISGGSPIIRVNGNGNGRNGGNRLAIDPNLPSTLFFGSRLDGLWKSTNRAANWSRVTSFPITGDTSGAASQVGIIWVLFDRSSGTPGNASQRVYAGVSTTGSQKIFRSTDAGTTWTAVPGQPTAADRFPIRAAITPDGNSLYLTYANHPGPNDATAGEVYRVSNPSSATPTWTALPLPVLSPGGWSGIAIDPSNPARLLVSTLDRWGAKDDLYRSTDGGATWKAVGIRQNLSNGSAVHANSVTPHWIGDVQIDPFDPDEAIFTTGNGLYRCTDLTNLDVGGATRWTFHNTGLEQSAVLDLVATPVGNWALYSGIGDRDGFRHDNLNLSPHEGCFGQSQNRRMSTTSDLSIPETEPGILVRAGNASPYAQFSFDAGRTWSWFSTPPTGTNGGGRIEISADATRVVWDPSNGPISYATRSGTTWSAWKTPSWPGNPPADAKLVADPNEPKTFYAYSGTSSYMSTDGGATWTLRGTAAPTSGNHLRAVRGYVGHLFLSTGTSTNGLWRSTDRGTTWTRVTSSAVTRALSVAIGAAASTSSYPSIFVSGTVNGTTGFFRSDDNAATWVEISDAAHQYGLINVIQADPRIWGRIYIGTNGRGIIVGDAPSKTRPPNRTPSPISASATRPDVPTSPPIEPVSRTLALGSDVLHDLSNELNTSAWSIP